MNNQVTQPFIKPGQFLEWQGIVQTGGEAKMRIKDGEVFVDGRVETGRGKKSIEGDRVEMAGAICEAKLE